MSKPIIQIKIEGPQGSGKSELAELLAEHCLALEGYTVQCPASSYDAEDSYQLENHDHIIQIRTVQTPISSQHKGYPRYHVQMPEWYMPGRYLNWTALTIQEKKERTNEELKKVSQFLEGNTEQANVIITLFLENYPGWKIELIDNLGKEASNG